MRRGERNYLTSMMLLAYQVPRVTSLRGISYNGRKVNTSDACLKSDHSAFIQVNIKIESSDRGLALDNVG